MESMTKIQSAHDDAGPFESRSAWLLLAHQLPPKPAYFRVKIWRRLQDLGSVAIKASLYALPSNTETREDFQWLLREIQEGGGEATLFEARLVDGLTDQEVRALFDKARDADYDALAVEARASRRRWRPIRSSGTSASQEFRTLLAMAAPASRRGRGDRLLRRQRPRCRRRTALRHRAPPRARWPRLTTRRKPCLPSRRNRTVGPG